MMLREGFSAVFVGTGAGLPWFLGIEGENLKGVYSSNEFLTRVNLMKAYKFPQYPTPVLLGDSVAVVGGGNVAMDAARCAKRLGAKNVYIVYRRTRQEMPARLDEVHHALEEGIIFRELTNPTRLFGDASGCVCGMELQLQELGEPDASGRRRPMPTQKFERVDIQQFVVAVGNGPNPMLTKAWPELKVNAKGNIVVDKSQMTNIPGVFAGGDITTGAATVIEAMGAGKRAAASIINYLRSL
jgi:glutamate synthase (NADPH/NADH) small chain